MNIYLAARYSRRLELCGYRDQLVQLGHRVTSTWLNGDHQISRDGVPINDDGEALIESMDHSPEVMRLREQFAIDDLVDIASAHVLVAFSEPPRSTASRGGRHVEFGYAHALGKRIWVVGPPENLFHYLPGVRIFPDWEELIEAVSDAS